MNDAHQHKPHGTPRPHKIAMQVRIPEEVRDWIKERAQINGRSNNSEFVQIIRAEMARDARAEA